jgi:hypothetical protein
VAEVATLDDARYSPRTERPSDDPVAAQQSQAFNSCDGRAQKEHLI